MKCYAGKMLKLNLTNGKITKEALDEKDLKAYIGGKGLGVKFLSESVKGKIEPLSADNPLIFTTGPVNGLPLPGASRVGAFFKSPQTGLFGESYCGGHFAPQLKFAGYDAIIFYGASSDPVYLVIRDSDVKLKRANHLWGKDTYETEDTVKADEGKDMQVACIGPGGENLVKFACISHARGRQFGRCGAGAVMGFKKLKAIAAKGSGRIEPEKKESLDEIRKDMNVKIKERLKALSTYGTPNMMNLTNATGSLPTRYWSEGEFDGFEKINAEAMKKNIVVKSTACYACIVACGKLSYIKSGLYAGTEVEGPEYETLYSFGSLCGNSDLESIAKANDICDRLGIDTMTAGNVVAFIMECYEKGILSDKETDGLKFNFGNTEAIIEILPKIAYRKGLGSVLAEGVKGAAKRFGKNSERLAVHVKGLEPAGYDPRGLKAMALSYGVSVCGATHLRHVAYRPNLTGKHPFKENVPVDRLSYSGQTEMVKELEDFQALVDSMIFCKFVCLPTIGPILWSEMAKIYSAATGVEAEIKDISEAGIRINNMVKKFNTLQGASITDDFLPEKFYKSPLRNGNSAGQIVEEDKYLNMLQEYYRLRGWSKEGKPS